MLTFSVYLSIAIILGFTSLFVYNIYVDFEIERDIKKDILNNKRIQLEKIKADIQWASVDQNIHIDQLNSQTEVLKSILAKENKKFSIFKDEIKKKSTKFSSYRIDEFRKSFANMFNDDIFLLIEEKIRG